MQKLLLAAIFSIVLVATTAENGDGGTLGGNSKSWSDILSDSNLKPSFEKFDIDGHKISYDKLCLMGERVRTKKKHFVVKPTSYGDILSPSIHKEYLVEDIVSVKLKCQKAILIGCTGWEEEEVTIPKKIMVPVRTKESRKWEVKFKKPFKLENCKK